MAKQVAEALHKELVLPGPETDQKKSAKQSALPQPEQKLRRLDASGEEAVAPARGRP